MAERHRRRLVAVVACALCWVVPLVAETGAVEVNGVTLHYEVAGEGRPLVLVHGWAIHGGYWDEEMDRLANEHTVVRYDRRGCGRSGGRPDLTADAADLAALLDHLGIASAHVMGHSLGAQVALTFAARYPERVEGLILFGPAPTPGFVLPPNEDDPPFGEWAQLGQSEGIEALRVAILQWAGPRFGDAPTPENVRRAQALVDDYQGLDLLDPAPPSMLAEPARIDELPSIEATTMVIHGVSEMTSIQIGSDVLVFGLPNAHKVVLGGGGHNVNWAEPERFAAEILRFLRDVESATAD